MCKYKLILDNDRQKEKSSEKRKRQYIHVQVLAFVLSVSTKILISRKWLFGNSKDRTCVCVAKKEKGIKYN